MSSGTTTSVRGEPYEVRSGGPVLFLLASGLLWLLVGLVLSLLIGIKLQFPAFGSEFAFLSYGRLQSAAGCALVYGFAAQVGLGLSLWLLARLGGRVLPGGGLAGIAAAFWNVAISIGIPGILAGQGTGLRWLELPRESVVVLFLAYLILGILGTRLLFQRSNTRISAAQAWLLVALFWFPWIFSTAQVALVFVPVRGVLQAIIGGWYTQALFLGWLTSIALALLYALIPELSGKVAAHSRYAGFGFWSWLLFSGWTAGSSLVGGPVPAWIPTLAVASGVLLLIPTVLISLSLHSGARLRTLFSSPALFLATASGISFTVFGVLTALTSFRCAREVLQFTQFFVGLNELFLFGFVGFALFAGIYVAVPRILGVPLRHSILSILHVAGTIAGVGLAIASLLVGGWFQGWALQSGTDSVTVVRHLQPWLCLNFLGVLLFLGSQLALLAHLLTAVVTFLLPFGKPVLAWVLSPTSATGSKSS